MVVNAHKQQQLSWTFRELSSFINLDLEQPYKRPTSKQGSRNSLAIDNGSKQFLKDWKTYSKSCVVGVKTLTAWKSVYLKVLLLSSIPLLQFCKYSYGAFSDFDGFMEIQI